MLLTHSLNDPEQQLKLRGQAPKALRWKRLEQRYKAHKQCVTDLLAIFRRHNVQFSCVNRVELDRQHLADVDLLVAVGGDGTVLSAAHFIDHGTIPLLGVNSDPNTQKDQLQVKTKGDERRSHGALCMCTAIDMEEQLQTVLYGGGRLEKRTRIRCKVKGTFSETRLVPALNDLLVANPSPAAVSRFRMGWLQEIECPDGAAPPRVSSSLASSHGIASGSYGAITRFGGKTFSVVDSLNVWSSGMWISTATGSTAAMAAAGGMPMDFDSDELQYLIREHMIERAVMDHYAFDVNNAMIKAGEKLHIRWNSQKGRIFIDGSHLTQNLELGDEIYIDNQGPKLPIFTAEHGDGNFGLPVAATAKRN